jgi:hypothetical protein
MKRGYSLKDAIDKCMTADHRNICYDHKGNMFTSKTQMCSYYGINNTCFHSRLSIGWSLEAALTTPVKTYVGKAAVDHTGKIFSSKAAMCRQYGVSVSTFKSRMSLGWSLKKALTTKTTQSNFSIDHLGNKFPTISAMCAYYHISPLILASRLRTGWTLEKALTTEVAHPHKREEAVDHLGQVYKSISAMARAYGMGHDTFIARVAAGMSLEEALTTPVNNTRKEVTDHLGNTYPSIAEMARTYGMDPITVRVRLSKGWPVKDALINPIGCRSRHVVYDHLGNAYPNNSCMARAYGFSWQTVTMRLKKGHSLQEALTMPLSGHRHEATDHLGKKYDSESSMARAYGLNYSVFRTRLNAGWSLEKTLTTPIRCYIT